MLVNIYKYFLIIFFFFEKRVLAMCQSVVEYRYKNYILIMMFWVNLTYYSYSC